MTVAWFTAPYQPRTVGGRPGRYCAMDDFTEQLRADHGLALEWGAEDAAAGGYQAFWSETEQSVDTALVMVDGSDATIAAITATPGFTPAAAPPPADVPAPSSPTVGLLAFPTTSLLDSFNRADENPLSDGGKWSGPLFVGDSQLRVISNKAISIGTWGDGWRNDHTYGPNCEAFATWNATDAAQLHLRLQAPGTTGVDGYFLHLSGSSWSIWRIDNNAQTQVGSTATQAMSSGDTFGFEAVGSALKGYRKASGGSWTSTPIISVTDSTYGVAGYIGAAALNSSTLDDFGGGTYVAPDEGLHGILLAPDDYAFALDPVWQRIDLDYRVQSWSLDRGRQTEMSRTDTGTATINLVDTTGDFDPTNTSGAFYGRLDDGVPMGPLVQAVIALQNPVTETWSTLYRGFISSIEWTPYRTEAFANVTLRLVDALAIFAAAEMAPDGSFGDDFKDGNIIFKERDTLHGVQDRINDLLDDIGWAPELRSIFTGNVRILEGKYPPRSTVSQVMFDAADAEFPDVSNIFIGGPRNPGKVVFHGRKARFEPTNPDYDLMTWQAGDDAAAEVDPDNVVRISPPLVASLDDTLLYTSAIATPDFPLTDAQIAGQYVQDALAVATKGLRTWSAENLLTLQGAGSSTGLEETKLFADYIRDNYATPRVRVGQLTIKSRDPHGINGPATWALLGGIDISDVVHLKTTHAGGGGFDSDFYVEGIHYTARPGGGDFPIIELTLDVTPAGYYDLNPFA